MSDVSAPSMGVRGWRVRPLSCALWCGVGLVYAGAFAVYFAGLSFWFGLNRGVVQVVCSGVLVLLFWWSALWALGTRGVRDAAMSVWIGLYFLLSGFLSLALAPLAPPDWVSFVQDADALPLLIVAFVPFGGVVRRLRSSAPGTPPTRVPRLWLARALVVPLLAFSVGLVSWTVSVLPEVAPAKTLTAPGEVDALAWSPDDQHLAVMAHNGDITTHDGDVTIWNSATWRQGLVLPCAAAVTGVLGWSADGAYLAANCGNNTVQVWDASGALVKTFVTSSEDPQLDASFAWSPSGDELAWLVQTEDASRIEVWNVAASTRMAAFPLADQDQWITWSPDGRYFAVTDESNNTVAVLDAGTARQVEAFTLGEGYSESIAWSPDSTKLLFAGNESYNSATNIVAVWDVATGQRLVSGTASAGLAPTVSWSPDGGAFAVGSDLLSGMAQVYDMHTGRVAFSWLGQPETVTALAWSPDGREIASGTLEGSLMVWLPVLPAR